MKKMRWTMAAALAAGHALGAARARGLCYAKSGIQNLLPPMKTTLHDSLWSPAVWLLTAWTFVFAAQAQGAAPGPEPSRYVEGELLVKFKGGTRGEAAGRVKSALQHAVKRDFEFIGWQRIQLPTGVTVEEALARYQALPEVLAVEPNWAMRAIEPVPTDPPAVAFGSKAATDAGGMPNDPMFGQQWGLAKIGVTNAWAITTGSTNVVVAVIDTGINYNHEDLRANMWRNPGEIPGNGIDDDGNGYVDDVYGWDAVDNHGDPMDEGEGILHLYHGTICAGIIGAVGNNGIGLTGVNWSIQLMAVRNGSTANTNTIADSIESFQYVTLMKRRGVNIRATSNSYSTDPNTYSQALKDAIDAAGNEGILNVCAAGNLALDNEVNPFYPASYSSPSILSVAASDINDNLASFSDWGRTNVHLAAPGKDIVSLSGSSTNAYYPAAGNSGTSYAAPLVSGSVALLAAAYPEATAADLKAVLLETVDVLPAFTNKMVSHGRLNVGRAMTRLGEIMTSGPLISAPPLSQTVLAGATAVVAVGARGARPLDCQWYCGEAMLSGATNLSLTLSNAQLLQAGNYTAVLSNRFGAIRTDTAVLTVLPLLITAQPRSQFAAAGNNVTFSVTVASAVPVTCQWQGNGINLPNGTNLTCTLTNVQSVQEGDYGVVVSNRFGSVTSDVATLTVLFKPRIVQPPQSQTVAVGQTVRLEVAASGTSPLWYRWRRNGVTYLWPGNPALTFPGVALTNAGRYEVAVTNLTIALGGGTALSSSALLIVVQPPTNQTVALGSPVTLRAIVGSPATFTNRFRWLFNGTNALLSGTNTATSSLILFTNDLVLTNFSAAQAGAYTFLLSNAVVVTNAVVTTNPPAPPVTNYVVVTNWIGAPAAFTALVTLPTESEVFRIDAVAGGPPAAVSLPSSTNRLYTLLACTDLSNPLWVPVPGATDLPGTGSLLTLQDTNRSPAVAIFYRVSVRAP